MRRRLILFAVLSLAVVLRIYAISLYPLTGDEYGSLLEARTVGLNWNSILYSLLMHFWIQFGTSELWLRLPAAIFGVATVGVLFKIGERLGGFRAGVVVALFAATSPFNIYHSQEVRFYSLFILTTSLFMLVTMNTATKRAKRGPVLVLLTSFLLFFSHFLAPLALYAQGTVAWGTQLSATRRRLVLGGAALLFVGGCALLLTPAFHHGLWAFYQSYGNAPSSLEPAMMPLSLISLGKVLFAGFIFNFGYHVYPLRVLFVAAGAVISIVLLFAGVRRIWKETKWGLLPVAYLLTLFAVYVVLDGAGGRLANGVSPRHVAFVWPAFVVVMALGAARFQRPAVYLVVAIVMMINGLSVRAAWQKDWTYGNAVDYRAVAQVAARWMNNDTAIVHDDRSSGAVNFYFPSEAARTLSIAEIQDSGLSHLTEQRLILVTDDWEPERRANANQLLKELGQNYSVVDGYVDYPLFAYLLESRTASHQAGTQVRENNPVELPVTNYGLEFQDIHLPITVSFHDTNINILGASALPDVSGNPELSLALPRAVTTDRVVLLSDVINADVLPLGQTIGEVEMETQDGNKVTLPLRYGAETTSWTRQCDPSLTCQTVFQWRKRLAVLGQNRYPGSLEEFSAGIHAVEIRLPQEQIVVAIKIRYTSGVGQLYLWGLALPPVNHQA